MFINKAYQTYKQTKNSQNEKKTYNIKLTDQPKKLKNVKNLNNQTSSNLELNNIQAQTHIKVTKPSLNNHFNSYKM